VEERVLSRSGGPFCPGVRFAPPHTVKTVSSTRICVKSDTIPSRTLRGYFPHVSAKLSPIVWKWKWQKIGRQVAMMGAAAPSKQTDVLLQQWDWPTRPHLGELTIALLENCEFNNRSAKIRASTGNCALSRRSASGSKSV
jgi:hypothetical protein